ncbi:MAG: MCP four helix bundle domain-containing protein, partial [Planctomycetota bacterium]
MLEGAAAKGGKARETGNPRRGEQAMWSWFGNIKTMWKLMTGFAIVGAIMAGVGYVGISNMGRINSATENIYEVQLRPLMALTKIRGMVHQVRGWAVVAVLARDKADQVQAVAKTQELAKQIDENMQAFEKTIRSEEVRKAYEEFRKALSESQAAHERALMLAQSGGEAGEISVMGEGASRYKNVLEAINSVVDVKTKIADGKYHDAVKIYGDSKLTLTGIIAGGIALGLVLGWLIARFLSRNLADVITAAQGLGSGDLKARSSVTTQDEVGQLAQAFNDMGEKLQANVTKEREQAAKMEQFMVEAKRVLGGLAQGDLTDHMANACEGELDQIKTSINTAMQNLTNTLMAVREGAEGVTTGSEQISRGNEDLSQRTSEQASALEETSSSMEEMTSTVKQNADNAKQANQLAIAARDVAEKGGAVTTKAVEAMGEINKSSKKIADIITV